MGVQSMHQRRPLQHDPNPRVTMAVDATLVTLGYAKPTLQIEIVSDVLEDPWAHEEARHKAQHHLGHLLVNRLARTLETLPQFLELPPPIRARLRLRFERRGYFCDVLDVAAQRLLLRPDGVQAAVDAVSESAELLLGEPPFFSSRFRWIDSRTSPNASAIRKPGG